MPDTNDQFSLFREFCKDKNGLPKSRSTPILADDPKFIVISTGTA